ncbi:tyrosinase [Hirsutella rhossiliensis]|uniref:Tyrosinase n=1 Tax=Hirsutella rhossiliensis TaxID=111463 RepID=A0A9P8N0Q3_9HYPO|nr:tyrosinase [Hirsutella rhossiliensis]KAH0964772.1 tyrosinase [Hirsutella rhossiliensis]
MLSRLITSSLVLGLLSSVVTANFYPITGVKVQGQNTPPRRNINELHAEAGPQWDLYIQAIAAMQSAKSTDPLSWFQLCSIHGSPPIAWNNTAAGDSSHPGYCAHAEALFLPWHRPYIATFEQSLVNHAKEIARRYPTKDRARYVHAAEILRTPFWDWAANPQVPKSTVPSTLKINTAHGRRSVKNPLAGYVYPKDALKGAFGEFKPTPRNRVGRCPPPKSFPQSANQLFRRDNLRELVYNAFIYSETFEEFSSTAGPGTSVEQAHNLVHNSAGCGQTMGDLAYAAYDPLFWLHHTNVDRLYALWQAAHPDKSGLTTPYKGNARFTTPDHSLISPDSPLTPFYLPGDRPHTSNTVHSTYDLGYTYEGLEKDAKKVVNQKRDESTQATERSPARLGYQQDKSSLNPQDPQIIVLQATYTIYPQPTHLPQLPAEEHKRRARGKITNLYASPAHKKKRTVHRAHVNYRVEELPDRPCVIDVYLCGFFIGDIVALGHPHKGSLSAAVPLNAAIETCNKRDIKPENYHTNIGFVITTVG